MTQQTSTYSKSATEALEKCVNYVQERHQNDIIDIILVFLLLN